MDNTEPKVEVRLKEGERHTIKRSTARGDVEVLEHGDGPFEVTRATYEAFSDKMVLEDEYEEEPAGPDPRVEKLEAANEKLQAENRELRAQIDQLTDQVEDLTEAVAGDDDEGGEDGFPATNHARALADEHGVDLSDVTPEDGEKIRKADVERVIPDDELEGGEGDEG